MPKILPVSLLTGNPEYISKLCHEKDDSIFLTKDGYGDMVVMSMERYEMLKSLADAYANQIANKTEADGVKNNIKGKTKANDDDSKGIEKLPIEDVEYILKQELQRRSVNNPNQKRFP